MASRAIVCLQFYTKNGVRQLLRGHYRNFSKSCYCRAADEGSTTEETKQQTGESEGSEHDADSIEQEEHDTRQRILQASLPFVHQHGWTRKTIAAGAETEGFPSVSHGMFPQGGIELVHYFYASSNESLAMMLAEKVKRQGEEKPHTQEFIRDAVETRLRMILPYIDTWPQAMAIMSLPPNAPQSLQNLANLMDDIWFYAGDRSVDFNWYTKRATLAAVYKSTEIYMLQDRSEDHNNTWAFLDRRLSDLRSFGKVARNCSQMGTVMNEGLWSMFIVGRNLLGMNPRQR